MIVARMKTVHNWRIIMLAKDSFLFIPCMKEKRERENGMLSSSSHQNLISVKAGEREKEREKEKEKETMLSHKFVNEGSLRSLFLFLS